MRNTPKLAASRKNNSLLTFGSIIIGTCVVCDKIWETIPSDEKKNLEYKNLGGFDLVGGEGGGVIKIIFTQLEKCLRVSIK